MGRLLVSRRAGHKSSPSVSWFGTGMGLQVHAPVGPQDTGPENPVFIQPSAGGLIEFQIGRDRAPHSAAGGRQGQEPRHQEKADGRSDGDQETPLHGRPLGIGADRHGNEGPTQAADGKQ